LSVPVQVIAWKDSSPKWPIMCYVGRKTLLTHTHAGKDEHSKDWNSLYVATVLLLESPITNM